MKNVLRSFSPAQLQAIAADEDPDFELVSNEIVDTGLSFLERVMVFSADDDDFTYQVQAQAGPPDDWEKPAFHDVSEDLTGYAVEAAPGSLTGWQRILVSG
ncbi:hypothetical protein [Ancylobacter oerskovii]|uniref:Uncharacterized protein n=1 Tax=Ancylobacter oerskovii TaxID=459519 RepID=A0ABW4Z346_9HYPH|nr:hypothetical protein [Ancylobacter oerskovii]MBS7546262.1 hypothetical protein [Ancylobacter oerskovii]